MRRRPAGSTSSSSRSAAGASPAELAALAPLCAVFRRFLKTQDLKYTPERADILNAIIEREEAFEVEALMASIRGRGRRVSKATMYRTIKLLLDAGIITPAPFDREQSHYHLAYGREPLNTIVCVKSGRTLEFTSDELNLLRDRICAKHGWSPLGHQLQILAVSPGE